MVQTIKKLSRSVICQGRITVNSLGLATPNLGITAYTCNCSVNLINNYTMIPLSLTKHMLGTRSSSQTQLHLFPLLAYQYVGCKMPQGSSLMISSNILATFYSHSLAAEKYDRSTCPKHVETLQVLKLEVLLAEPPCLTQVTRAKR